MPDEGAIRLGQAIREARNQRGWTQAELAAAAGTSVPTINRCENAKTATKPPIARALFDALGLDPRSLPVLLGYVTAEEMAAPVRVLDPITEQVVTLLIDPEVSPTLADEVLAFARFRQRESAPPDSSAER
ncbi:hypothetical protein Ade02nite_21110 [Paractinoplanes deccanensis]|uniref:HTH cro/C1-type domain-containing protein n=1 Tax=Paractinoplanes deccanensis TaxID=113561 RepID=A0ABQ3Y0U3_9ACTN|nr:helix-turn-helix transcriptional regulator [Actinoplanes deccanensis]GID73470.1 hypothetical protein Ade02nite_21110 [Actinoplanes deccanensis]